MSWTAIVLCAAGQAFLFFYAASTIKAAEFAKLRGMMFLYGLLYTFLLGSVVLYAITLNPATPGSFAPVGLGYFSANVLLSILFIYFHGLHLMQAIFKGDKEED